LTVPAIADRARRDPRGTALVDDTAILTWAELAGQVEAVGAELLAVAGGSGERVAVVGENVAPTLVAHLAGLAVGVGTVAVSRQLTAPEMADQLSDAGVVAVVTGPLGLAAATQAAVLAGVPTLVVHGAEAPAGAVAWASWTGGAPRRVARDVVRPPRPPLVYTSGTTGRARATEVRWTAAPTATAREYLDALAARPGFPSGPHLVVGPLQHNAPLTSIRQLLAGEPVVVLGRFDPERVLALIEQHRITSVVMVPTHFQRLLALPEQVRRRYDVSSLRVVPHTGSACPPDVKRKMIEWFGPVLVESYGGSEIGTVCRITSEEWLAHPGSVGRSAPPYEVVVLDENGQELGPGETGLLGFRTPPELAVRYHADPEKTAAAYVAPGVATLGDVGHMTEEGYVYITDRASDMVVSGGVNLYPAESERVLREHPGVAEVAVIGVPDADLGESLHALVVPAGEAVEPSVLAAFCRSSLAAYKCPKTYEFVDELARNAMGKLDKRALRRPYWESDRTIAG
jgi:acyl-CoA synthetase (AMP-forming)/AMP-acid ligase II